MATLGDALAHRVRVQRLLGQQAENDQGQRAAQLPWRHAAILVDIDYSGQEIAIGRES
jgi:hypothetical protein